MGNIKYGEFTFSDSKAKPAAKGYERGGPKKPAKAMKREPEAMVRKEVALLRKAGAQKPSSSTKCVNLRAQLLCKKAENALR